MVLMYLLKRLWRAAISAIFGYVYIPRCTVRHRMYTLILWLRKFYRKWLIRIFVDRDFLVDKVFHRVVDKAVFVDEVFY